ncbi:gene transfer agent family protein [Mesorhizobium sp. CN2-181]|uniref:gene transfer agent family protein n=1 Tax=Mesorhizobium yinganensis TaxID=3157707 RepID=UPI0032B7D56A
MSRRAFLTVPWADGDYTFRLPWGQLAELQEATGAGPYVVLDRLRDRTGKQKPIEADEDIAASDVADDDDLPPPPRCGVKEIGSVIRLGLIGGGLAPHKALKLVRTYVEDRVPEESRALAWAILHVALYGAPEEDDSLKKKGPTLKDHD